MAYYPFHSMFTLQYHGSATTKSTMATITYLTTIEFDFGAVKALESSLASCGVRRPLIVTDRGIVSSGILARVTANLAPERAAHVFCDTPSNPTEAAVHAAAGVYRANECDGLVAVGGGSPIDLAKAVALTVSHEGPLSQYAAILGGVAKITARVAPVIVVPTTAGTGSEVGRAALITLQDGRKLGLISPHLIPRVAICDPELTLGLPPSLTAATGMDALTHCIETFLSPKINPPAEAIALDGAARAAQWIERAVKDGQDRDARWNMMMAALQGGLTFQKGLGAVHSISHPLGGLKEPVLHHGTLNAVILPAVLRFNEGHVGDKYDRLRAALSLPPATSLADYVSGLNQRIGMPSGLRAMGVPRDIFSSIAVQAVADHSTATNPRPAKAEDFEKLMLEAWGG
jgi:4-hydroxybutyrate dehydrogenase